MVKQTKKQKERKVLQLVYQSELHEMLKSHYFLTQEIALSYYSIIPGETIKRKQNCVERTVQNVPVSRQRQVFNSH